MDKSQKQVNKQNTKLVRIDVGWHKLLKIEAARAGVSMRELLEACLAEGYQQIREDFGISKRKVG